MVGDGATIEGDDGHVADQKMELPRTSLALLADPFVSSCAIETKGPDYLFIDLQSMPSPMETASECGGSRKDRHEHD